MNVKKVLATRNFTRDLMTSICIFSLKLLWWVLFLCLEKLTLMVVTMSTFQLCYVILLWKKAYGTLTVLSFEFWLLSFGFWSNLVLVVDYFILSFKHYNEMLSHSSCTQLIMVSCLILQTQAEVALAAADGDPNVAVEILMSQQACI